MGKNKKTAMQKHAPAKKSSNLFFWILTFIVVAAAIAANYYFADVAWALKAVGWIVVAAIVVTLVGFTAQGKALWKFMKEARVEMRKVVWPKRDVTVRTTAIVAGLVVLAALILWALDSVLLWLIGLLTG